MYVYIHVKRPLDLGFSCCSDEASDQKQFLQKRGSVLLQANLSMLAANGLRVQGEQAHCQAQNSKCVLQICKCK